MKPYIVLVGAQIKQKISELGYTPKSALEKELLMMKSIVSVVLDCVIITKFKMSPLPMMILRLLNEIGEHDALIVNVVDIFDFNGSIIPGLHRFVGKNPVLMIGNKVDVLQNH